MTPNRGTLSGEIVLCPPQALGGEWLAALPRAISAAASGWLQIRARARQQHVELPLVISDHCDWLQLTETIRETGAGKVWVMHGREDALLHYCRKAGIRALPLSQLASGMAQAE